MKEKEESKMNFWLMYGEMEVSEKYGRGTLVWGKKCKLGFRLVAPEVREE